MRALYWLLGAMILTGMAGCSDERAQSAPAPSQLAHAAPDEAVPRPIADAPPMPKQNPVTGDATQAPALSPQDRQLRLIRLALEDCRGNARSLQERMREGDYADLADHADEIYKLAQGARLAAVDIPGAKGELLVRDMGDLQHAADELRDAARKKKHQESHHAMDTIDEVLKRLEKDVVS